MTPDERRSMHAALDAVCDYAGQLGGPQAIRLIDRLANVRDCWPAADPPHGYPNPQVIRDTTRAMERLAIASDQMATTITLLVADQLAHDTHAHIPRWQYRRRRDSRARCLATAARLAGITP